MVVSFLLWENLDGIVQAERVKPSAVYDDNIIICITILFMEVEIIYEKSAEGAGRRVCKAA